MRARGWGLGPSGRPSRAASAAILALLLLASIPVSSAADDPPPAASPSTTSPAASSATAPADEAAASPVSPPGSVAADAGATAPPPAPPLGVSAKDQPGDEGKKVVITWTPSADDGAGSKSVKTYQVLRGESRSGPYTPTESKLKAGASSSVEEVPENDKDYFFVVRAVAPGVYADSEPAGPARSSPQWYKPDKTSVLIFTVVFCAAAMIVLRMAHRGTSFYVRPIGGIDAIDEAIGRATEMGKPILYVCGLQEADNVSTLASFSILSRVARKAAEYQSRLIVPCYYSMVMVVAREVVKSAYLEAGRPDAYREQDVFYVTQEQFAYVAAVNGIMLREKPATNFYLGGFFAESLVLAETGFRAGSIQIAGTDQPIQIPFFVAACDYTLIGEELYAAAAYLSDDPKQRATLKAQDFGKACVLTVIGAAVVFWTLATPWAVGFAKLVADGEFLYATIAGMLGSGS